MSADELAAELKLSDVSIRRHLETLQEAGVVKFDIERHDRRYGRYAKGTRQDGRRSVPESALLLHYQAGKSRSVHGPRGACSAFC